MNWLEKLARPQHGLLGNEVVAYRSVDLSRAEDVLKNGFSPESGHRYFTTDPDRAVFYANFTSEAYPGAIFECIIDSSRIEADMNDTSEEQQKDATNSLSISAYEIQSNLKANGIKVEYYDIENFLGSNVGGDIGGYYDEQFHPSIWMAISEITGQSVQEIRNAIPQGSYGNITIDSRGVAGWTEIEGSQMRHPYEVPVENISTVYLHSDLANMVKMQYESFSNGMPQDGFQDYVNVIPYQRGEFQKNIADQLNEETNEDLINELQSLSQQLDDDEAIIDGPMYRKLHAEEFLTTEDFETKVGGFVPFKLPEQRMNALLAIRKGLNAPVKQDPQSQFPFMRQSQVTGLNTILNRWQAEIPDIVLFAFEKEDKIVLDSLILPRDKRKQGIGSQVMTELVQYADQVGKRFETSPGIKDPYHGTTSRARLVRFYRRFGLIPNKGRNKDYSTSSTMLRDPKEKSDGIS